MVTLKTDPASPDATTKSGGDWYNSYVATDATKTTNNKYRVYVGSYI